MPRSGKQAALIALIALAAMAWMTRNFSPLPSATPAGGQQSQTSTAPLVSANAKYTQGVGIGYWPTAGSGLTLNLAAGTAFCGGSVITYAGGTLTMTASMTNNIYLNTAAACVPAVKTTAFTSSDIPIAAVVTSGSAITSITDDRTPFFQSGGGTTGPSALTFVAPNSTGTATQTNKLACYTDPASSDYSVTVCPTSANFANRFGAIAGIVDSGAGTTGNATIAFRGPHSCVFVGATTAGHIVVPATGSAGSCQDGGTPVTSAAGVGYQIIGTVQTTNGGAGTYTVNLMPIATGTLSTFPQFYPVQSASNIPVSGNLYQNGYGASAPIYVNTNSLTAGGLFVGYNVGGTGLSIRQSNLGASGVDALLDMSGEWSNNYGKLRLLGAYYTPPTVYTGISGNHDERIADSTVHEVDLTGNANLGTLYDSDYGQPMLYRVCQDATGGRTWSWGTKATRGAQISQLASVCTWQMFVATNNSGGNTGTATVEAIAPALPIVATKTAQTAAIADTTLTTPQADMLLRFTGTINCTAASSGATATLNLKFTDTSNTVQTVSTTAACTALGPSSFASMVQAIRSKSGTAVTYGAAIAGTPTYDLDVRLETL